MNDKQERKEEIKTAYRELGRANSLYDGMMLGTTRIGRFILKHVWNMTIEDAMEYQAAAFEPIPSDFSGKLLEVPVGTGVLSMPVWKRLPSADITCLDYSEKMMESAQERANKLGITNITFQQGDVGALPYEDESFDALVSLNGFHAFPDKQAAYDETWRVLKPGGLFTGCFYVSGRNLKTDRIIRSFYIKFGFFTEPFETIDSLRDRLSRMYSSVEVYNVESIAVFHCTK